MIAYHLFRQGENKNIPKHENKDTNGDKKQGSF
jgi:hypothetical protein